MKSIQEVCSSDHTPEEIKGWGHRPYREDQRLNAIANHSVYVALIDEKIEGFLHFNFTDETSAYVFGLYITQKALGKKMGAQLMSRLFEDCRKNNIENINLHSTLTAHGFYKKFGFVDSAPMTTVQVNGVDVRCIPMKGATSCELTNSNLTAKLANFPSNS